ENGEFKIKSNADSVGTTKFDLAKIKKFDINSSFCAEIELTNKNFTENKIYFKNGENEIISIAFTPEKYTIFYGEKGKPIQTEINEAVQDKKIKLELWFDFEKNTFDVYEKNDEGYRHIIINKPILTEENSFDNIVFATSENAEICISDFKLRMNKIDMPTYLEKNFTFDKISTETPGNITKDFDLIKNVFGAEVVWDSSEQNLINSSTGKIKIPEKETVVILKATVTYNQESFEKKFNIIMGLNNLCDEKIITSTARATDGTNIKNLNDNDRTTYFKTKVKKSFEITVDLEREVDVSKVMLLGDNLENIIKKYSVHISNDNKKYVKICDEKSGTLSFIPIPIQKARFVKLVIDEKTDEAVSLSEFVVGFSPTDEQIVNADILNLVMPEEVSESFEATLIAPYGAEMEYKSSKENVIRFEKSGDKVNAVVTKPENSSIVTVTAVAKFGRASQSSIYNIAVKGYKNIPNDKPSSSGGGGGNSGGRPPSNIINTTPEDVITPETPDQKFNDELNGHWAEKEIREMINLEIINGDEGSLKLENNITRAEFIAMIVRSMKLDITTNTNKFSDVESGSWYADYIETAFANNLISGDGGEIRPNDAISREEMSKIIVNTYCLKNGVSYEKVAEESSYKDSDNISPWAVDYVAFATKFRLINGFEDGEFKPKAELLREQAAVVLYKLINNK
ncbi:MAG: S-layer homology domain-containing protein, partial [Oscillospiraceae bacterium]